MNCLTHFDGVTHLYGYRVRLSVPGYLSTKLKICTERAFGKTLFN